MMIDLLEQLSNAVGIITKADVRQVADAINRRVMELVGASVIKLYWTEEAERGTILSPFTFVNETQNDDPRPFQLSPHPDGVLSWVYYNETPLWLEGLRNKDLTQKVRNEYNGGYLPPECIDAGGGYESMMCIPLMVRGAVRGLYSVELQTSGRLKVPILGLLQRLGRSLSSLLWNADVYEFDQQKTSRAVQQFLNSIRNFAFDPIFLEENFRAGFIARPFEPEYGEVEARLARLLLNRGIRARAYRPSGRREYIVDDIEKEIRNSHFCIADVTKSNANVMAEVGMMMTLRKRFLLLRKHGDSTPPPFDIDHLPLHEYDLSDHELRVWDPAANRFQSIDQVLDDFIAHLPPEAGYSSASAWTT